MNAGAVLKVCVASRIEPQAESKDTQFHWAQSSFLSVFLLFGPRNYFFHMIVRGRPLRAGTHKEVVNLTVWTLTLGDSVFVSLYLCVNAQRKSVQPVTPTPSAWRTRACVWSV